MGFTGLRIGAGSRESGSGALLSSSFPESSGSFAPHSIVEQCLHNLPDLNPEIAENLRALSGESDRGLFFEGLLSIGRQLESGEHPETAAVVYSAIVQNIESIPNPSPSRERVSPLAPPDGGEGGVRTRVHGLIHLRRRAQARLDAVNGVGSVAPRSEFLLRHLARQAIDPSMIVGMGVAGIAYRSVRLSVLSRLAGTPVSGLLTRGFGARLTAASVGFLAEAPFFTAAVRGTNVLLGRVQDWSPEAIWTEFAGGATTLFCLKITGAMGGAALRRFNRGLNPAQFSLSRRAVSGFLPQASTFAGILAGHKLEEAFGFREAHDGATFLTDGLATLLQFHVGGRLSHHVMGESFRQSEQRMEMQGEALDGLLVPPPSRTRGRRIEWRSLARQVALGPFWMMMGAAGEGGGMGGASRPPIRDTAPMTPHDQTEPMAGRPTPHDPLPPEMAREAPAAIDPATGSSVLPSLPEMPRFRPRLTINDETLKAMEAFPGEIQREHQESSEPNPVYFGLNSMKWWLGMVRRDAGDLGAQALIHSGRILFGRFQESQERQSKVEERLWRIADGSEIGLRNEAPSAAEWWRPVWERGVEDAGVNAETMARILQQVRAENAPLAEEWLLHLAVRDFERSEWIREIVEGEVIELRPPPDREAEFRIGPLMELREAVAGENYARANELISELYRLAWQRPNLQEVLEEIGKAHASTRIEEATGNPESLVPPPILTGRAEEDFPAWLDYAERVIKKGFSGFSPESQLCLTLARERIARSLGHDWESNELLSLATRLNAALAKPMAMEHLGRASLAHILGHFDFYRPQDHHLFTDFHVLAQTGRAAEAIEKLTQVYTNVGSLIFALARIARSAHAANQLHLFSPRAAEPTDVGELIIREMLKIKLLYEGDTARLNDFQKYSILSTIQSTASLLRGQSRRAKELQTWADETLKGLGLPANFLNMTQMCGLQFEPGTMEAIDIVSRLAREGQWSDAFAKLEEFARPQSRIILIYNITEKAKQSGQIAAEVRSPIPSGPRPPADPDGYRNKLLMLAYRLGNEVIEVNPRENAEAFTILGMVLGNLGDAQGMHNMLQRAQSCDREYSEAVIVDTATSTPEGKTKDYRTALEFIERRQFGELYYEGYIEHEQVRKINELIGLDWEVAHDYLTNYFQTPNREHAVEPMLLHLTVEFLGRLAAGGSPSTSAPRTNPSRPALIRSLYDLDSLPVREIHSIPEEHRHLIPRSRREPVFFPRFRRALDELASLVQAPERIAIRLFGPAGTGKSTLPEIIAGRMGTPLLRFPTSKRTDPSDFDGSWRMEVVDGRLVPIFEEGVTTVAMENGYHLVLDEPDLARPGTLAYLNNVAAPGRTAWVRKRDGRLSQITVDPRFRVWATENGMRELGREEHGRDFLRRFVPYHFGTWTQQEIMSVLGERFQYFAGRERWEPRVTEMMATLHTQVQRLAQGMEDPETHQVVPPLGSGIGQRVEFTPRSVLRLAQRLVAQGPLTPESLSRAIRSEYILPLAEASDRELVWNQARAVFGPLLRSRGWQPNLIPDHAILSRVINSFQPSVIGPHAIPVPTLESLSQRYLDGRPIPEGDFVWTSQALHVAEEILWNRSLGIDVMLLGDAGEGKTELPRQIADLLRVEYFQKTVSSETDEEDLVGGPGRGENGEITFVPDIVVLAAQRGGFLHLDEYLLGDTGRLESVMNPLMDDARAVYLKNPYRRIDRDPSLSVILSSNPPWEFQDRHEHSAAAMSRVAVIYLSGEYGMQSSDRLQILRRWAGSSVAPIGEAEGSSQDNGGGSGGRGGSGQGRQQGSPEVPALEINAPPPQPRPHPRLTQIFRQIKPEEISREINQQDIHPNGRRRLIESPWRATHQMETPSGENKQRVVDLDPEMSERFGLPHQLVFDTKEGSLLEISEDGSFVPLSRATQQNIQRLATRLTRQTQVEMGIATNRVFKIVYGMMTGHTTFLAHQTIRLDIADMLRRPYLANLGIGKHEWAHATIDRPSERYDAHEPGRLLANVIGDPRMNEYFASLREDFREQMEVMAESAWPRNPDNEARERFHAQLPHEQFAYGVIHSWMEGRVPDWLENPQVRDALERALPLMRPAFTLFPESTQAHHVDAAADGFYRIVDEVWPIYEELIPQSQQELIRRIEAGESPEELMNPLLERLSPTQPGSGPIEAGQDREAIERLAQQILEHRAGQLADRFEPNDPHQAELRRHQIEAARNKRRGEENPGDPPAEVPPQPLSREERQEIEDAQRQALQQSIENDLFRRLVPPRAIQAAQRLRRILPPENPTYLEGHFTTGKRLDRRKAVQDAIAPVPTGRVMLKRIRPGDRSADLVILSDVSHSMVNAGAVDNSLKASAATIYLCEQLGIRYGEILFDEAVTVAKTLGGPLRTYARKNELLSRKRNAFGGSDTNIRDPLALAIDWLRGSSAGTKAIVLITDGAEGYSHKTRKTLPELEAEAQAIGIQVFALAMGNARRTVPQNFKHYRFASADGSEIPDQLVELIEETHRRRFPR